MPVIRPFRGIHYDFARHADLTPLLSPPYDAVDEARRAALEAQSPWNAVHLEAEGQRPGDGGAENRFSRSARYLEEWRAQGVLVRDDRPAIYALEQRFEEGGEQRVRHGFLASLELQELGFGVLPHEQTLPAPGEDRFRLYRAARANTSPIFCLYADDEGESEAILQQARSGRPNATGTLGGVENRLWRMEQPEVARGLTRLLAHRRAFIADGHHRYEMALAHARACEAEGAPASGAHRTILACFCPMSDPGLVIRPVHRLVTGLSVEIGRLLLLLDEHFDVEELVEDVRKPAGLAWAQRRLAEAGRSGHALLLLAGADRKARLLRLKEGVDLSHVTALPRNPTLRTLDVALLQGLVLRHTLGLREEAAGWGEHLAYVRDEAELVTRAFAGADALGFLVNPTPMWQVRAVAEAGERMPARTTFFHPKVPAGLVFHSIDPHDPA